MVDESDCFCALPLDLSDEELESYAQSGDSKDPPNWASKLTGFLLFSRLCQISARISKASKMFHYLKRTGDSKKCKKIKKKLQCHGVDLEKWLHTLPDEVKFSLNHIDPGLKTNVTMCTIMFILHSASTINLHWCVPTAFVSRTGYCNIC